LREILELFRADGPRLLGSIRAAIAGGEAAALNADFRGHENNQSSRARNP
jgi:hypothetical protein